MATASPRVAKETKHRPTIGNGRRTASRVRADMEEAAQSLSDTAGSVSSAVERQLGETRHQLLQFWNTASEFGPTAFARNFAEANREIADLYGRQVKVMAEWPSQMARLKSPEDIFKSQFDLMQEMLTDFQETSQRLWSRWAESLSGSARRTARSARRMVEEFEDEASHFGRREVGRSESARARS